MGKHRDTSDDKTQELPLVDEKTKELPTIAIPSHSCDGCGRATTEPDLCINCKAK